MQHLESHIHQKNLNLGLTVEWVRARYIGKHGLMTGRHPGCSEDDTEWVVVCYSNGWRWLFDDCFAEMLTLLGTVKDGLNRSEILEASGGVIIALYDDGARAFHDRQAWLDSMPDADTPEAETLLSHDT